MDQHAPSHESHDTFLDSLFFLGTPASLSGICIQFIWCMTDPMPAFTREPRQAGQPLTPCQASPTTCSPLPSSFLQAPARQPTPYPTLNLQALYHKPSLVISYLSPSSPPTLFYSNTILIRSSLTIHTAATFLHNAIDISL